MISVAEALEQIRSQARPLSPVSLAAGTALGQTLAEDISSDIDSPPWDKSLMDGYAVRAADVSSDGTVLTVLEEITAGKVPTKPLIAGTCSRIMTGAPLPTGADAVVVVERSEALDVARVRLNVSAKPEQNILRRAASMQRGSVVLRAGQTVRPIEVGVLAEVGRTNVLVTRRPRVAILSTGDELVEAAQSPAPGQIRNSNGPMLAALVAATGAEPIALGIARDNEADLQEKIARGLEADMLLLSGGVSAGLLDLVPKTLASLGVREVFHKVNLKPGKPVWFGTEERTNSLPEPASEAQSKLETHPTLVFGLPGNPVSTLVCFGLFVKPALAQLAGLSVQALTRPAALTKDFQQRDARPTYFPAVLSHDGHCDHVTPLAWRGSADLRALADANCLAYFPAGEYTYPAGQVIETYSL